MKKIKFILPLIIVSVIAAFAFVAKKTDAIKHQNKTTDKSHFADTYFVFNGTSASQYTDSTKWTKYLTNPTVTCGGTTLACKIHSATLSTRTQLVNNIDSNGIDSDDIIMDAKKP